MEKFLKITTLIWHGIKIILHLTDKKEKVEKMKDIENSFKK